MNLILEFEKYTGKKPTKRQVEIIEQFRQGFTKAFNQYKKENREFIKGFYLWGDLGTGKTTMMKLFLHLAYKLLGHSFTPIIRHEEMKVLFHIEGYEGIKKFGTWQALFVDDLFSDYYTEKNLFSQHYGDQIRVIDWVIERRYEAIKRGQANFTVISSNYSPTRLKELLGVRAYDRIQEMVTPIEFNFKGFREKW